MNLRRFIIFICVTALAAAATVATFNFYWKEKPFYQRLKAKKRRPYQLQNIRLEESKISGDLKCEKSTFTLNLSFLNKEIIHLQINDPESSRYVVQDVVTLKPGDIKTEDINIIQTGPFLHIECTDLKVLINSDDFELVLYKKGNPVLLINSEKLFTIEEKEPYVGLVTDFVFPGALRAYGLPQHAEKMSLASTKTKPYRLFNTDRFAYSTSSPQESLYGAVPLIFAHGTDQTTGLFWLNASDTYIDIDWNKEGLSSTFLSEGGSMDFYVLTGPTLQDCVRQNSELTGTVPLPPIFALGYHQSRYSYMTQEEVMEVSDKCDENDFPLDCIWMDIDYTDDKKYFTWNPSTFPNPEKLLEYLDKKKRKAVAIIDPHIKVDDDYFVYARGKEGDFFVKNPNTSIFTAKCWPGTSSWIDFLNPKARCFYADLYKDFVRFRNLHIWNDMNEPALFEIKENAMPKNVVHHEKWKHRDVHNLYGFYQTMATYDGLLSRPDLRPFILTRSHFAGSQRYAAIWTGDNTATWAHLQISIPMCITASLAGFSFCGADIGGFVKHPDDELLQRWYQVGTWLPFFRNHSNRNVPRREPYLYDKTIQKRIRSCLQERYRHLLYWYSLFWQHRTTLQPVIRPLIYQYPHYENVLDLDNEFLVGDSILVCPVIHPEETHHNVYLPGGEEQVWYYVQGSTFRKYTGTGCHTLSVDMDSVPVFYRGGCIIPIVEEPVKSSGFMKECPIALYIFCNEDNASGTLYFDDMESFRYLKNDYVYVRFVLENSKISNVQINRNSGYTQPVIINAINLYSYNRSVKDVQIKIDKVEVDDQITLSNENDIVRITGLNINLQKSFSINLFSEDK